MDTVEIPRIEVFNLFGNLSSIIGAKQKEKSKPIKDKSPTKNAPAKQEGGK